MNLLRHLLHNQWCTVRAIVLAANLVHVVGLLLKSTLFTPCIVVMNGRVAKWKGWIGSQTSCAIFIVTVLNHLIDSIKSGELSNYTEAACSYYTEAACS